MFLETILRTLSLVPVTNKENAWMNDDDDDDDDDDDNNKRSDSEEDLAWS